MPRFDSTEKQIQIKVTLPPHLYQMLQAESQAAAVTMADLVRLALTERYRRYRLQSPNEETDLVLKIQ